EVASILEVADGIGIPSISDMPHDYIEQVADAVRERGAVLALHVSERVREDVDFALSLDPAFLVHMCQADDSDLTKCAEAEVPVVMCPTSNAYFGMEPPVARALGLGVDIAVGTDNGMFAKPDTVAELGRLTDICQSQGGDVQSLLPALDVLRAKLLYRHKRIERAVDMAGITVIPAANPWSMDIRSAEGTGVRLVKRRK
ncbi:MAG: hypothetical protein IJ856_05345, partial [Candidatus Methanomethylophilaceae archaeon]|nr:hypothetical protein [Candidatus Methanomethylophilaceae archaeon]